MTKLRKIKIQNVKGIGEYTYENTIIPNKPTFFVAPNGFGKSSISIAFDSLKPSKIELIKDNCHNNKEENLPSIELVYQRQNIDYTLIADENKNELKNEFDIFVINSKLRAKAKVQRIGGTPIPRSSMEIETTVLVKTIPAEVLIEYNYGNERNKFKDNKKICKNISEVFENYSSLSNTISNIDLEKFGQQKNTTKIQTIFNGILELTGTSDQIKEQIEDVYLPIQNFDILNNLNENIEKGDFECIQSKADSLITALQMISVYQAIGKTNFNKAKKYLEYKTDKQLYDNSIAELNSTRFPIKSKEHKNSLIVEWPKAHKISNGQRDILTFIALLIKAKKQFKKKDCILIIDEVFDYLDDANLIAFQYYISNFINDFVPNRNLFPIILTHLDPNFFNHFCFSDKRIQVHYLKEVAIKSSKNLLKLIYKRDEPSIKSYVDQYYFHFNITDGPNLTNEFNALGLEKNWALSIDFHKKIQRELRRYMFEDNVSFDTIAVCIALRIIIEKLAYNLLNDATHKNVFINNINGTKNKLEFCISKGRNIPSSYFLLGLIYNNSLHLKVGQDITKQLSIKLDNQIIKNMILQVYDAYRNI